MGVSYSLEINVNNPSVDERTLRNLFGLVGKYLDEDIDENQVIFHDGYCCYNELESGSEGFLLWIFNFLVRIYPECEISGKSDEWMDGDGFHEVIHLDYKSGQARRYDIRGYSFNCPDCDDCSLGGTDTYEYGEKYTYPDCGKEYDPLDPECPFDCRIDIIDSLEIMEKNSLIEIAEEYGYDEIIELLNKNN